MKNPIDFLETPVADALGWTLLHAVWQGFALVLPTAVLLYGLRGRSSDLRYRIGVVALLTQLLASAATFAWYYRPALNTTGTTITPIPANLPVYWRTVTQTLPWHQQVQQFLENHLNQFVLIYLIGVVVFGLRLAGGWVYLQRLSRTAALTCPAPLAAMLETVRARLAIQAVVRVRESAQIAVPMVVGVLKPVLLLPIGLLTNLSAREVEAILAHELAHIKRHDYAVNLLQSVIEVLYFFHPALWWLSARVREEREHCCDDLAVRVCGGNGRMLAQALAHVEELRLAQMPTPALAMALATRRQQLLHRVRRVLGVPTRPIVSNGSLAGLTLATLLLVSASVYAVQQQDKPKPKPRPRTTQPQSTRRHKVSKDTEFGMSDNRRIDYIIWKGQKLPASRVATLQRQFDQVGAGQLNIDDVKQPNRDILLQVIETNRGFSEGMDALANGLAHIDYDNIINTGLQAANAAGTFPVDVTGALKEVEKIDYNSLISEAMASVPQPDIDSIIQPVMDDVFRRQDSLLDLRETNREKAAMLRAQAQSQGFAVEAVERKIERLERQKSVLEQRRMLATTTQQQAIFKSGFARNDSARSASAKQIEAGELAIQQVETEIEKMNQQLVTIQAELEKVQKPLRETEAQLQKLNYSDRQAYLNLGAVGAAGVSLRPSPSARPSKARKTINGTIVPATPDISVQPVVPTVPVHPPAPRPAPKPKAAPAPKPGNDE